MAPAGRGACWGCAGAAGACWAGSGAENSAAGTGAAGAGLAGAGFGPGRGAPDGAEAAGVSAAAGLGAGAPGFGAPGRAACAGEGADEGVAGDGFAGAALRGAPGLAAVLPALPPGPCSASVSLRTTGASIVEDAERTNSPSSWSLAMTTLLSTPNSLASSYTRTFATSLLLGPGYRRTVATSWAYSSRTHRVLIAISTYFQLARYLTARLSVPFSFYGVAVACSTNRLSADVPSGARPRKARGNARRRTARARHSEAGWMYAPRPGSVPRGSGTHSPSISTMRSSSRLAARSRHPTQVRSGHTRACVRPDTIKSTSPRRPRPMGAKIERLLS